ncbi:DNA-3-methyladenine glycosylase [Paramicrobacterium chengjingii]|uniref:Putative 3-methyladenine DNA glycosylase n=1 Tax=Paramicrobacterium chengjingii TaxID=2769067 RepID=A0ABX6YFD3_9MICO|nr:DNA-3-methyladenine glycosylase [Microbacterium chengjingii]QPZ37112.1 DNA-3-methyladenine glycosylase [Microbacterium chengjingii]
MALDRALLLASAVELGPSLLGSLISHTTPEGTVTIRLSELEAYVGNGVDPGSHAHRGKTKRNASMFGEPGHLYAYFTYGMHVCGNIVCSPEGQPSGLLMRGGEVVEGIELARHRRTTTNTDRDLARGPGRLAVALGIQLADDGSDVFAPPFLLRAGGQSGRVLSGPRTGVSGPGGSSSYPWRFWIEGDPTVSPYKRHPRAE